MNRKQMDSMNMRLHQVKVQRKCFTLIEVLLALTLTTLVVTLTGRIAVHTLETRNRVNEILRNHQRCAARAFEGNARPQVSKNSKDRRRESPMSRERPRLDRE